jgi:hypothetical protein
MTMPDGVTPWRGRWQTWDAPFSTDWQSVRLTQPGVGRERYQARPVREFKDASPTAYWNPDLPYNSVKTAGSGVDLRIQHVSADRRAYKVRLR